MSALRLARCSLQLACLLAAAGAPLAVSAIEAQNSSQGIQQLVSEARELLPITRSQINDLYYALQRAVQNTGDTSRMFSNSYEYRELKRSATRFTEIGNNLYTLASRCGADGKKIGTDFKSRVRRLSTDVNRIASSSTPTLTRQAVDNLERDLQDISGMLPAVAGIPDCSAESDDESDEEPAKSE